VNTTGPQAHLTDPAALSSDLQTVSGVLLSPTFHSFSKVSDTADGLPSSRPSRIGMLASRRSVQPARHFDRTPDERGGADAGAARWRGDLLRRYQCQRRPAGVAGHDVVWNNTTHKYEQDGTFTPAAPTTGAHHSVCRRPDHRSDGSVRQPSASWSST